MLSVALCTYNGAHFIEEQLWSILNQTLPVDEIVVCDDGSTDATLQIIEEIKGKVSTKIYLYQNETNLGVLANFQKAVDLCQGDIVFLSDQDDIWYPNKVEAIVDWFDAHSDKSVVFTNADLIDENGREMEVDGVPCKLWDYYFCDSDKKMFDKGLALECMMRPHATGASMAIRKTFLEEHPVLHQTNNQVYHDMIICINALEVNLLGYIDDTLFKYRLHEGQQIGVGGYTRDPDIVDWRCPIYPEDYIFNLLKKEENIERVKFLSWRNWTKHRIYGPLVILLALRRYHKYYGKVYCTIMAYDIKASLIHSKLRIFRKVKSLCFRQCQQQ